MKSKILAGVMTGVVALSIGLVGCNTGQLSTGSASSASTSASSSVTVKSSSSTAASSNTSSTESSSSSQSATSASSATSKKAAGEHFETAFTGITEDGKYFVQYVGDTDVTTGVSTCLASVEEVATGKTDMFSGDASIDEKGGVSLPAVDGSEPLKFVTESMPNASSSSSNAAANAGTIIMVFEKYGRAEMMAANADTVRDTIINGRSGEASGSASSASASSASASSASAAASSASSASSQSSSQS